MTYDPFAPGPFAVEHRTFELRDHARGRAFPIDVWQPGPIAERRPVIVFSHAAGQHRRSATFLCTQLCSHGYAVAAMDHSEVVTPELARVPGETEAQKRAGRRSLPAASPTFAFSSTASPPRRDSISIGLASPATASAAGPRSPLPTPSRGSRLSSRSRRRAHPNPDRAFCR